MSASDSQTKVNTPEAVAAETSQPEEKVAPEVVTPADPKKHAFSTLVMLNEKYVAGALVLAWSIKSSGSKASLVALVTKDVSTASRTALSKVYDQVVEVPTIEVTVPSQRHANKKGFTDDRRWVSKVFSKLAAFKLTDYEKVCHLDADMYCVKNPDNVFTLPAPSGICTTKLNPEEAQALQGTQLGSKGYDAVRSKQGVRGCIYLLEPSKATYDKAISLITAKVKGPATTVKDPRQESSGFADAKSSVYAVLGAGDDDEEVDSAEAEAKAKIDAEAEKASAAPETTDNAADDDGFDRIVHYQYGDKKAQMGPDELLFLNLFMGNWHYLHPRYGHTSWKPEEAGPQGSIFLHFSPPDHPWSRQKDWPDYAPWDATALSLIKAKPETRGTMLHHVAVLAAKEKGEPVGLPQIAAKAAKPAQAKKPAVPAAATAPATATTTPTTTTASTTTAAPATAPPAATTASASPASARGWLKPTPGAATAATTAAPTSTSATPASSSSSSSSSTSPAAATAAAAKTPASTMAPAPTTNVWGARAAARAATTGGSSSSAAPAPVQDLKGFPALSSSKPQPQSNQQPAKTAAAPAASAADAVKKGGKK